jgi:hypothetical protein
VKSAGDEPGGTGPLVAAILPDERFDEECDENGQNCVKIYLMGYRDSVGGSRIEIPFYLNKKAGDKINLTFAATDQIPSGGADIPGSHWTPVEYTVPSGDEESESSFFDLPEANLLAVTIQGTGLLNYTVENAIAKKAGAQVTIYIDNRIPT